MTYSLTVGLHEDKIIRQALKNKRPVPTEIMEGPELKQESVLAWGAFFTLRRGVERTMPLRWVDVQQWCQTYGLSSAQSEGLHESILILDALFVDHFVGIEEAKHAEAKRNADKAKRG